MDVILNLLFGTPIGLLSLFTIGFAIAMVLFLLVRLNRLSKQGK